MRDLDSAYRNNIVICRVEYRLDLYDSGAKTILLKRFRFLNGARTDTFFKIKSKQQR